MTKTVLIIEDDCSVAELLADVLADMGYQTRIAQDGEWALRSFADDPADLVVVDMLLPQISGKDVVHRLRILPEGAKTPVIVVSGVYPTQALVDMVSSQQISGYFEKPVDLERFRSVVSSCAPLEPSAARPSPTPPQDAPEQLQTSDVEEDRNAMDPELRGELGDVPFARLIGRLYHRRRTGALLLRRGSVKKIVYLKRGVPIFIKSNLVDECLGRIMLKEKLITEDECARSVEVVKSEGRKQGEVLIAMGCISTHNLQYALQQQLRLKLFDVFGWTEGKYLFTDVQLYRGGEVALSMTPAELVYEGMRRGMSDERVERELERWQTQPLAPAADPTFAYQVLQLEPKAHGLVDIIDGMHSIQDAIATCGLEETDARLLVYALACTGLVQVLRTPTRQRMESVIPRRMSSVPQQAAKAEKPPQESIEIEIIEGSASDYLTVQPDTVFAADAPGNDEIRPTPTNAQIDRLPPPWEEATRTGDASDGIEARYATALLAEEAFRHGLALQDAGDWTGAADALERATRLNRGETMYRAHWAWASFQATPDDDAVAARALQTLEQASNASPDHEEPCVFAAQISEQLNRKEEAAAHYERALARNPDCVAALQTLRKM